MIQHANNEQIVKPLENIKKDIAWLKERKKLNKKVRENLAEKQRAIVER